MKYEYSQCELDWIRLSSMEGVGPNTFFKILAEFPDLEYFFQNVHTNIEKLKGRIRPAALQKLSEACGTGAFCDFMAMLEKKSILAMTLTHPDYPLYLKEIKFPPPVLYVKGSLANLTDRVIGIVGTRHCTRRGYTLSKTVAQDLAQSGVAVVSGLARGIDTAAHNGAVEANGITVAVLGCGVDTVYPAENDKLYARILEKGAVVSEYVPGTQPLAQNFPARNRIISGMSRGVYVVESSNKGGACITVSYAMNQGRDVFAAAGSAFTATSEFTNMLCQNGCPQVFDAQAILGEYGWERQQKISESVDLGNIQLDFLEQLIYNLLLTGDMTIEEISQRLDTPQNDINVTITLMEMNGIVKRLPGLQYSLY